MYLLFLLPLSLIFVIVALILRSGLFEFDFSHSKLLSENCMIDFVREFAKSKKDEKFFVRSKLKQISKYIGVYKKYIEEIAKEDDTLFEAALKDNRDIFLAEYKNLKSNVGLRKNDYSKMFRVYEMCKIIVGGGKGFADEEIVKKAVLEFNKISPLNFNEIVLLPFAFSLVLLEYFCVHIYHMKKMIDIKKIVFEDIDRQRINVAYLKDKNYLHYFLRLANNELGSVLKKICEINEVSIENQRESFEVEIANFYASINGVFESVKKKCSWLDNNFLIEVSKFNKIFNNSNIAFLDTEEKIHFLLKLSRQAKKKKMSEVVFAKEKINAPDFKVASGFYKKSIFVEVGEDIYFKQTNEKQLDFWGYYNFALTGKKNLQKLKVKTSVKKIGSQTVQEKMQVQKKILTSIDCESIFEFEFFNAKQEEIYELNDFSKNAFMNYSDEFSLIDSLGLLYADQNVLKEKIIGNFEGVEAVFALCEYVEHTKDTKIFGIDNIFERAAKILLDVATQKAIISVSDRIYNYKKNKSMENLKKTDNNFYGEAYMKILNFYTVSKFLCFTKNNVGLRKLFLKIRENLRNEIGDYDFERLGIDALSLAVVANVARVSDVDLLLKNTGEKFLDDKKLDMKKCALYIAALQKKNYTELAFSLLKIILKSDAKFLGYRLLVENFLGIKICGDIVSFFPKLPKDIGFVKIKIKLGDDDLFVDVDNSVSGKTKWSLFADNINYNTNSIILSNKLTDKKIVLKKI